jgi:hypothetical protein
MQEIIGIPKIEKAIIKDINLSLKLKLPQFIS